MFQIGIIAALPDEIKMLTRQRIKVGEIVQISPSLSLCIAGMGSSNAEAACQKLQQHGVQALISWGCAGALNPQLRPGNLLLPMRIIYPGHATVFPDTDWLSTLHQQLPDQLRIVTDELIHSPTIVARVEQKNQLFRETRAGAVDMESHQIGRYAKQHGLPFLCCRSVADSALTTLPQAIINASDENGQVNVLKLLLQCFRKPKTIKQLIQTGRDFHHAKKTLTVVAKQLKTTQLQTCEQAPS